MHKGTAACDDWAPVIKSFEAPDVPLPAEWKGLFEPLRRPCVAVGQIGQSLDGRIATASGHSHYINGAAGLDHLHRLRSVMDAVVVGIGTVLADDPQLTVRRVVGRSPARVVIDPKGRLPHTARLLADDGTRRLLVTTESAQQSLPAGVEVLQIPADSNGIAPAEILTALRARGLARVLIEGGAATVSRFLTSGCLDRLHVMVAPVIFGSGQPGLTLPAIERANDAMRPPMNIFRMGDEVLFDCDLSAQRAAGGLAKKSR